MSHCPVRFQPGNSPKVFRWSVGGQIYQAVWKAIADPGRLPVEWEERPKSVCSWFPPAAERCMAKYLWISDMTTDPSPTADATRLTEPERTSPTAYTPGWLVPNVASAPASLPVMMKPLASTARSLQSHVVFGLAPIMTKIFEIA